MLLNRTQKQDNLEEKHMITWQYMEHIKYDTYMYLTLFSLLFYFTHLCFSLLHYKCSLSVELPAAQLNNADLWKM